MVEPNLILDRITRIFGPIGHFGIRRTFGLFRFIGAIVLIALTVLNTKFDTAVTAGMRPDLNRKRKALSLHPLQTKSVCND